MGIRTIKGWSLAGLLVAAVAQADPPGSLVIKPGGNGAQNPNDKAPDKAGFVVIRPQKAGETPSQPKLVGNQPSNPPATPSTPTPRPTEKPATPPMPEVKPANPAPASQPEEGRVIRDLWYASYIKDLHVGYSHLLVREYEREGQKFLYATRTLKLTIARFGERVDQWSEDATMETPEGAVVVTRMRQGIGRDQMLSLTGQVKGNKLAVKIEGAAGGTQEIPWPEQVLGVSKEMTLLKDRQAKPGDTIDFLAYEGRLNRVIKQTIVIKGIEETVLSKGEKPRKLLRADQAMEPIGTFRLPPSVVWIDPESLEPLKTETDMPMFGGKLSVVKATKEQAMRRPDRVPDLFDVQSIRLDRDLPKIHDLGGVTYRVAVSGDAPLDKLFAQDSRQAVKNADPAAKQFELQVTAVRRPGTAPAGAAADPGQAFLAPNFYIDWDNDKVKGFARHAVSDLPPTASAWQKAQAVERWVKRNMNPAEFSQAMATCSNVARTLSGDCTEYAMLAAGMCRALGIPSRTAIGVVFVNSRDGKPPVLAYHMWFEVYANSQWMALDATLGYGSVGPGHLKITDASWHEEKSMAPLLPVLGLLAASPKVEVLSATESR